MVLREPRVQSPALESYSDVPLYNTKAVVHQTGVPAPTLRAWERRYGILTPRRGENDYRLYSERDIVTVSWLRERVEDGMTISQAIALLRSLEPARRRGRRAAQAASSAAVAPSVPPHLAMDEVAAALIMHFKALDELAATQVVAQVLGVYTVEEVCLRLFTPVLVEVGRLWEAGEVGVTVEHFASCIIRAQLDTLYHIAERGQTGPLVLVGCAPGELHEIGPLMLALFLRRIGMRVVYLGQSIELESLGQTILAAKPACVLLSATLPAHAETLQEVGEAVQRAMKPYPCFFFGGQGLLADPELASRVPGHYLPMDALAAAHEIRKRLSA